MSYSDESWREAKRRCRLNQDDVALAKRLGLNPKNLIKNIPAKTEQWKAPVKQWIHDIEEARERKSAAKRRRREQAAAQAVGAAAGAGSTGQAPEPKEPFGPEKAIGPDWEGRPFFDGAWALGPAPLLEPGWVPEFVLRLEPDPFPEFDQPLEFDPEFDHVLDSVRRREFGRDDSEPAGIRSQPDRRVSSAELGRRRPEMIADDDEPPF
ncbi:MAG: hypothetical protein LBU12_02530 [Deltaproteobacteria bacterium]|jgi:hypothetical protein|nr:hypothetical protein [Deltaproteobacteria bacterium]